MLSPICCRRVGAWTVFARAVLAAAALVVLSPLSSRADARQNSIAEPFWLVAAPGTFARVDIAPWLDSDEPEAALTASEASLARDFGSDAGRPADIVYAPVGVRVRIVAIVADAGIARVRGRDRAFLAYAPIARLVPEIPPGTRLRTAGGFQGFADFFPTLASPQREALRLETGSMLVALGIGTAAYDSEFADFVRVRVRVTSGTLRGRIGWIAVAYTGIPERSAPRSAEVEEKACTCRLIEFRSAAKPPI